MRIEAAGQTHVGMKRNHNEDNLLVLAEQNLFCVADGMGGHASGEIASKIAVDELADFYRLTAEDEEATWPFRMDRAKSYDENRLQTGIKLANVRIFERANSDVKYRGMGTTIVTLHVRNGAAYVAHVGDSRLYSFRDGLLRQLTEDHSLLNDYLKAKRLTPEEIEAFPHKNVIVRALGMRDSVQVDMLRIEPQPGEVFLLCSDGLSGMVSDADIEQTLRATPDLEVACARLIDQANAAGGTDNVTCIVARVVPE